MSTAGQPPDDLSIAALLNQPLPPSDISTACELAAYLWNHSPCGRLQNGTLEYRSRPQYSYIEDSVLSSPARDFVLPHFGQSLSVPPDSANIVMCVCVLNIYIFKEASPTPIDTVTRSLEAKDY